MKLPVIAIAWPKSDYVASLERAGATARTIAPATDPLPDALDDCDGLLLTGGVDVDPARYGAAERHPSVEVAPERDAYELPLARLALERDLPVLAICRGLQVLNVAAGGTLIQDIPSACPGALTHTVRRPLTALAHRIAVTPGTCLAGLVAGSGGAPAAIAVNSRHHQSVDRLAPGFVAAATAPDGIVEAIERPGARFCVGVQWHPENFWSTGEFDGLFGGFVAAARRHAGHAR